MKISEILNKEYQQLCQVLGDLQIRKEKIDQAIADTKQRIEGLNNAAGPLKLAELQANKEQKVEESKA